MTAKICYFPLCEVDGEQADAVEKSECDIRCKTCGRVLDCLQPRLVISGPKAAA